MITAKFDKRNAASSPTNRLIPKPHVTQVQEVLIARKDFHLTSRA